MKIVVDTNIVFSAVINGKGLIGDIIFNSPEYFEFFSPEFMIYEINLYKKKLLKSSKLTSEKLSTAIEAVVSEIQLVPNESIKEVYWNKSIMLLENIDKKDSPFLALALSLEGILWSGDKKLKYGLEEKGVNVCKSSKEIQIIRGY